MRKRCCHVHTVPVDEDNILAESEGKKLAFEVSFPNGVRGHQSAITAEKVCLANFSEQ
jgi:hypothetical protein